MELVSRIGKAQAMDVLSSQAGIAGHKAVLIAANANANANTIDKLFPPSMTAAGTVKPAEMVVLGVGAAAADEVASLGADFAHIPGVADQSDGVYARKPGADLTRARHEALAPYVARPTWSSAPRRSPDVIPRYRPPLRWSTGCPSVPWSSTWRPGSSPMRGSSASKPFQPAGSLLTRDGEVLHEPTAVALVGPALFWEGVVAPDAGEGAIGLMGAMAGLALRVRGHQKRTVRAGPQHEAVRRRQTGPGGPGPGVPIRVLDFLIPGKNSSGKPFFGTFFRLERGSRVSCRPICLGYSIVVKGCPVRVGKGRSLGLHSVVVGRCSLVRSGGFVSCPPGSVRPVRVG